MGLLARLKFAANAFKNAASLENPNYSLDDPAIWDVLGGGRDSEAGVRVTHKTALGYPPLWRGINLISGDMFRTPLSTYQRSADNGKDKATGHPAYRMVARKVSPLLTARELREVLTYHALIHGNGYAAIFRDRQYRPETILLLDPRSTIPAVVNGGLEYVATIGSEQVRIPGADVLHLKGLSHDGIVGHDVLSVMANSLGLGLGARSYASTFLSQGSNASGVLMVPGHFKEEAIKNTIAAWNKMQTGLTKNHRIALLQDGVKFQSLTIDSQKSQLLETRKFEIREVANILGIPPHKLGDDTRTSHSSLEQENQSYLDDSLDIWLTRYEGECDDKLLSEAEKAADSHFHEFNRSARVRTNLEARVDSYYRMREMGVLTINDVLRRESLPTIGPDGDVRHLPVNWAVADMLGVDDNGDSEPLATPTNLIADHSERVNEANRALLVDRINRLATLEDRQTSEARENGRNLSSWADKFYPAHSNRMREALLPAVGCVFAQTGRNDAESYVDVAVSGWLNQSRLTLSDDTTATERAERLVNAIMKDAACKNEN